MEASQGFSYSSMPISQSAQLGRFTDSTLQAIREGPLQPTVPTTEPRRRSSTTGAVRGRSTTGTSEEVWSCGWDGGTWDPCLMNVYVYIYMYISMLVSEIISRHWHESGLLHSYMIIRTDQIKLCELLFWNYVQLYISPCTNILVQWTNFTRTLPIMDLQESHVLLVYFILKHPGWAETIIL